MRFIWIMLILPQFLFSQGNNDSIGQFENHYNIVNRVAFKTNDGLYPLTALISPFGYLKNSEVWLGDQNYDSVSYFRKLSIGWEKDDLGYSTSRQYRFDTLTIDTICSAFGIVMCKTDNIEWINPDKTINIPDINSNLSNEFKYSYLFNKLNLKVENALVLRVTYPLSMDPFESNLTTLTMVLSEDSISLNSKTFDITDIFNITVEDQGNTILRKNHNKSFSRLLSESDFNQKIVCYHLKDSSIADWDFVLEYINGEKHHTFFLCSSAKYISNIKDRTIVRNYVDLFLAAKNFNAYYFGVGR